MLKFKKVLSIILCIVILFTLPTYAFAVEENGFTASSNANFTILDIEGKDLSDFGIDSENPDETISLAYLDGDGNVNVLSSYFNEDGSESTFAYVNGTLTEMGRIYAEEGYYEYAVVPSSFTLSESATVQFERIEVERLNETTSTASIDSISPYALPTTRTLGYMEYTTLSNVRYSILCQVNEWTLDGITISSRSGNLGTVLQFAMWLASLYGIPEAIASNIVANLIVNVVIEFTGSVLQTIVTTKFLGTEVHQEISGQERSPSTTHSGDLGRGIIKYPQVIGAATYTHYDEPYETEGYTTELWRTGELGRAMFYEVFGIEYTPDTWIDW